MRKVLLLILMFVSIASYSQNLNLGLRAYYPFSGNANDASGNNNNPVFNNATLTSDFLGNPNGAYHFNGTSTYMMIPNSPSLNMANQMSIAVKVRPTGWYTGPCYNNMMVMKGDGDYLPGNYSSRFADVYTGCTASPTTTQERFNAFDGCAAVNPIIQLNQWYSVVCTYDGSQLKIYVDCILKDSVTNSLSFTNSYDLFIGRLNNSQYPFWLNGDLDEVRIYDRALTQNEVNLYSLCSIAPVTLTGFNAAVPDNKSVLLTWNTEAESNIKNYSIERSTTGYEPDFISIGTVSSKSNAHSNSYSYIDNSAKPNTLYYYKLLIKDNDGSKKFSTIRTARILNNQFYTLVYPNPTDGIIKVMINNAASDATITIINELGQPVAVSNKKAGASNQEQLILDISNEAKGVYFINIQTKEAKSVEKIIKK